MPTDPQATRIGAVPPLPAPEPASGAVLNGRYRLLDSIGQGGFGSVHRAYDPLQDEDVAVKLLVGLTSGQLARVRREITALRRLPLPGVVRLLDQGEQAGVPYLVMELIEGERFPGGRSDWESLEETAVALLETLARIHALGVVHRDLKPANVLVDADGRPTVLDFGLATGGALGDKLTATGALVGTPHYFAPEQAAGGDADARSDLYAFGLMLYQALSGRLPHDSDSVEALLHARVRSRVEPLRSRAPSTPPRVARVIDQLLAADPEDRPQGAVEALALFKEGDQADPGSKRRTWLGGTETVDALVAAAEEGRSVRLAARRGAGTTRTLEEAAARLRRLGRDVVVLTPGTRPLSALAPLFEVPPPAESTLDAVMDAATSVLRDRLRAGAVLVVDARPALDHWSARVVAAVREEGRVIEGVPESAAVLDLRPAPLSPDDLLPLFAGPERLHHLPSDAAAELFRRTDGLPAAVFSELRAWVRAGLGQEQGDRVRVDRAALDRLASGVRVSTPSLGTASRLADLGTTEREILGFIELAAPYATAERLPVLAGEPRWLVEAAVEELRGLALVRVTASGDLEPQVAGGGLLSLTEERRRSAHAALGQLLPDTPARVFHLAQGGVVDEMARVAARVAAHSVEDGRLGEAEAVLGVALQRVREADGDEFEGPLLDVWTRMACSEGSVGALERALYELGRASGGIRPVTEPLETLARAALAAVRREGAPALALARGLPSFESLRTERRRWAVRIRASAAISTEAQDGEIEAAEVWARSTADPEILAATRSWRGLWLYRMQRCAEAAEMHAEAARLAPQLAPRLAARLNEASARMEAADYEGARRTAEQARGEARDARHAFYEARAEWIARAATYRSGAVVAADEEFVDLVADFEVDNFLGAVLITESGAARRAGDRARCRAVALRGAEVWRRRPAAWALLYSTAVSAGHRPEPDALDRLLEVIEGDPIRGVAFQVAALLVESGRSLPPPLVDSLRARPPDFLSGIEFVNDGILERSEATRILRPYGLSA